MKTVSNTSFLVSVRRAAKSAFYGVVGFMAATALPAHAGWTCSGRVQDLTLDPSGSVYMSLVNNGAYVWSYKPLCSLRVDYNGVSVPACKSIYTLLMTSVALGKTVTFWFDYPNQTPADCSPAKFPSWTALATDGAYPWYFGPKLD